MFKEYTQYDALGLAGLVNSGQVSAKELLDAAVEQANKLNPKLNAIIHCFDERAYHAAQVEPPAMSVPLGMNKKGLPIGMQFIGRMNDEVTLLSLAGEFERVSLFTTTAFEK